jgi:hypothetical protein
MANIGQSPTLLKGRLFDQNCRLESVFVDSDSVATFFPTAPVKQTIGSLGSSVSTGVDLANANDSVYGIVLDINPFIAPSVNNRLSIIRVGKVNVECGVVINVGDAIKYDATNKRYIKHLGSSDTNTIIGFARTSTTQIGELFILEVNFIQN